MDAARACVFSQTIMNLIAALVLLVCAAGMAHAQMCPEYISTCRYTRQSLMDEFVRFFEPVGPTVAVTKVLQRYRQHTTTVMRDIMGENGEVLIQTCVAPNAQVFSVPYMIQTCTCIPTCTDSGYLDMWMGNARANLTFALPIEGL